MTDFKFSWACDHLEKLNEIAKDILLKTKSRKIAFFGDPGSGKTTLIKQLCLELGIDSIITSPSFTILNEYQGKGFKIFHFDFYRVDKLEEIYDLGYEEYLFSDDYVFIEWPEKLSDMLPAFYTRIKIETGQKEIRFFHLLTE